jgi:hypothetical protein
MEIYRRTMSQRNRITTPPVSLRTRGTAPAEQDTRRENAAIDRHPAAFARKSILQAERIRRRSRIDLPNCAVPCF